jgi:hypothetical protein
VVLLLQRIVGEQRLHPVERQVELAAGLVPGGGVLQGAPAQLGEAFALAGEPVVEGIGVAEGEAVGGRAAPERERVVDAAGGARRLEGGEVAGDGGFEGEPVAVDAQGVAGARLAQARELAAEVRRATASPRSGQSIAATRPRGSGAAWRASSTSSAIDLRIGRAISTPSRRSVGGPNRNRASMGAR